MKYNNIELNVLIKGKPITEYPHNGQMFVEGRDGSDFEIQLRNHNAFRVEAIVSVDGLSVIDGKDAGPNSSGYLLEANETLTIPGWKLDAEKVAKFAFAGKRDSYAAAATGSARNTGVIGIMAFKEIYRAPVFHTLNPAFLTGWSGQDGVLGSPGIMGAALYNGPPGGVGGGWVSPTTANMVNSIQCSAISGSYSSMSTGLEGGLGAAGPQGVKGNRGDQGLRSRRNIQSAAALTDAVVAEPVAQTLGTAFGQASDFATQTVSFERGDLLAVVVMYYDDKRGLKARGVQIDRVTSRRSTQAPVAFPAQGCTPPAGWRG